MGNRQDPDKSATMSGLSLGDTIKKYTSWVYWCFVWVDFHSRVMSVHVCCRCNWCLVAM